MKQRLISIAFALYAFTGISQQFETLYDHNGFSNDGGAIIKSGNNYLTTHPATDPLNGFTTLVAYFNEEGDLLWDTTLTSAISTFSQSNWNINILASTTEQEKWIIGNYGNMQDEILVPFLQKFSVFGESLQLEILDMLSDQSPNVYGGIITDSGIYLVCTNNDITDNTEGLIIKCSPEGIYQWHETFDTGFVFSPKCITDVGDGFVVGGWRYATQQDQENNHGDQIIIKFNYSGNSIWTNILNNGLNPNLGAIGIVPLNNGNYLFAGTRYVDNVSIQPLVGEMDAATGDTLWTRAYFAPHSINRLHGFKKLDSGGYLGVGECRVDVIPESAFGPLDNAAFIMKLDDEFNLMWKKVFIPEGYTELESSPAQCQLNDFVENDNGSITALGRVYMYTGKGPQGGYIQDSYLIRIDSLGCLVSGCSVGITEFEPNQNLLVYPNPTNGDVTIEFPQRDNWSIDLLNMQGQLVLQKQFNQIIQCRLVLQNLPSGVYTFKCTDSNEQLYLHKIIKQ